MQARRTYWSIGIAGLILLAVVIGSPGRAAAHVRVFVGAGFGVPAYAGYGYPYPVYGYPYPPPAYYYSEPVPPPGFVPGHWEWRRDSYGNRIRVWVPAHLD